MHLRRATPPAVSVLPLLFAGLLASVHPAALAAGNPVQVNVTNTSPIPVDPTGAFTPVNGSCNKPAPFSPVEYFTVRCPLYTVPAGKRLFVDSVSWKLVADPNNVVSELMFGLDDSASNGAAFFLPSGRTILVQHAVTWGTGTYNVYEGTQSVQMVFEAGELFTGVYAYNFGPYEAQFFSFQGHLVNAP